MSRVEEGAPYRRRRCRLRRPLVLAALCAATPVTRQRLARRSHALFAVAVCAVTFAYDLPMMPAPSFSRLLAARRHDVFFFFRPQRRRQPAR